MSATDDRPIPWQSSSHVSPESRTEELTQKLSILKCDSSAPTHHIKPPAICDDGERPRPFPFAVHNPETNHSGYGTNLPVGPPSSCNIIDKPIPDDLNNRFLDFKIRYTEKLWAAAPGKKPKDIGDISMKLRYMGKTDADAKLFIIVQCESRILKKVKRFLKKSDVQETLGPNFHLHFIDGPLIRLFSSDTVTVSTFPGSMRETICGAAIEMSLNGVSRRATLGGLIEVTTESGIELYALTAGHSLMNLPTSSEYSSGSARRSTPEDNEDLENGWPLRLPESEGAQSGTVYNAGDQKIHIGTIMMSSFDSGSPMDNHDWALIKMNPSYLKPNFFYPPSTEGESEEENDFIEIEKSQSRKDLCVSANTKPSRQSAAIITCRGIQRGTLSQNYSTLFISPSNCFVNTLDFLPAADANLVVGDSGAWVINETTGEVYGHVVAIDGLGEAHVIPIHATLRSIKSKLSALEVKLPSALSVRVLRTVKELRSTTLGSRERIRPLLRDLPLELESAETHSKVEPEQRPRDDVGSNSTPVSMDQDVPDMFRIYEELIVKDNRKVKPRLNQDVPVSIPHILPPAGAKTLRDASLTTNSVSFEDIKVTEQAPRGSVEVKWASETLSHETRDGDSSR